MLHPQYPNLELIEYKTMEIMRKDHNFMERFDAVQPSSRPCFDAIVFPQMWGSTVLGFDVTPDGSASIGGQALTKAYTTVMHEINTGYYLVFFDGRPCYKVYNATPEFITDLKERNLASYSKAMVRY